MLDKNYINLYSYTYAKSGQWIEVLALWLPLVPAEPKAACPLPKPALQQSVLESPAEKEVHPGCEDSSLAAPRNACPGRKNRTCRVRLAGRECSGAWALPGWVVANSGARITRAQPRLFGGPGGSPRT